jgi:hypothetical protein
MIERSITRLPDGKSSKETIMARKLSIAITAGMLVSGAAVAAQSASPFPMSVNETGPNYVQDYSPRTATTVPALPAARITGSSTFPMSVSETGPNHAVLPPAAAALATGPSHAEMLRQSALGTASASAKADRTVRVGASASYVDVDHFELVRIVNDQDQSFVWKFDTLGETRIPLTAIAPAGFDAGNTVVYVRHPYTHLSTE